MAEEMVTCIRCKRVLTQDRAGFWKDSSQIMPQYCVADPVHGSLLHDPETEDMAERRLIREITKIWESFDHTSFNQQSVALDFARKVRALG